jgi:hypothetical protein
MPFGEQFGRFVRHRARQLERAGGRPTHGAVGPGPRAGGATHGVTGSWPRTREVQQGAVEGRREGEQVDGGRLGAPPLPLADRGLPHAEQFGQLSLGHAGAAAGRADRF